MAIRRRLADLSYRVYDRSRHESAFEAASKPGTAADFSGLEGHKYALLVTFRRDGTPVPTPIWFGLLDGRRMVLGTEERTAKVRRLRRDPHVRVFPSDQRGKPLGSGVEGVARVLPAGEESERADEALDRHYGRMRRVYEKVMAEPGSMVYVEVTAADPAQAPPS